MRRYLLILILAFSSWTASAQGSTAVLKGTVIDAADGYPLIGVSVMLNGTKQGTVTDIDGSYELKVPQDKCEVVFSYVGYDDVIKAYTTKNAYNSTCFQILDKFTFSSVPQGSWLNYSHLIIFIFLTEL